MWGGAVSGCCGQDTGFTQMRKLWQANRLGAEWSLLEQGGGVSVAEARVPGGTWGDHIIVGCPWTPSLLRRPTWEIQLGYRIGLCG